MTLEQLKAKIEYLLNLDDTGKLDNKLVANSFWRLLGSLVEIAEVHSTWGIEEAMASAINWLELEHAVSETHHL